MKKIYLIAVLALGLFGCTNHDEQYYVTHPKALLKAMKHCPARTDVALSCDQLKEIALRVNQLAYDLRMDQLAYGEKILALQEKRHQYEAELAARPQDVDLQKQLTALNRSLTERLFVVKWLESPRKMA